MSSIDSVETQLLWNDADLLEIPAKTTDEPRSLVIGMINDKHWSGVITYKGRRICIISVRAQEKKRWPYMKAEDFEQAFDDGEDILESLDLSKAKRSLVGYAARTLGGIVRNNALGLNLPHLSWIFRNQSIRC